MKVFVTGATGFIGRALSERLIDEGHAVRALARESASISSLEHLDLEIVPGDIRDADVVEKAMDGCEHVYGRDAPGLKPGSFQPSHRRRTSAEFFEPNAMQLTTAVSMSAGRPSLGT